MSDIETILNSCEDGDDNITFTPQTIDQSKLDILVKNYNELKGSEVVQNIQHFAPIHTTRRSLLEGQLIAINHSVGGTDILKKIADLIKAEPIDNKFKIRFWSPSDASMTSAANYDKNENTLTMNPYKFMALKIPDSNGVCLFHTAPLIHSTSDIEGEPVAKIEEGLSPDYMVLLHELGHYKDYKDDASLDKLVNGMRANADKLRSRLITIVGARRDKDYDLFLYNRNQYKKGKITSDEYKRNYLGKLTDLTSDRVRSGPLGRMRNVSGTQTNMDDHLEYKNVFSYYNDSDFSELKFRLDNNEPIRYLYQTKEGVLYEPLETIIKKAQYYSNNPDEVRQRLSVHFGALRQQPLELNNINVPYTKLRFADTFKNAFETYAGRACDKQDPDLGIITNDFSYFQQRLGTYHNKRKVFTQEMIDSAQDTALKARLRSKLRSRLKYASIPGDPKTIWLTKFWNS